MNQNRLPSYIIRLFAHLIAPHLREQVLGDLEERYALIFKTQRKGAAQIRFLIETLAYLRPAFIRRKPSEYSSPFFMNTTMIRNYFKIAFRNLLKNKGYSLINIGGLAVGMAVAMLIGIWINDELSANRHHENYETLYQIKMNQTFDGKRGTQDALPFPVGEELRSKYPDFKAVAMYERGEGKRSLIADNKKFLKSGLFIGEDAIDMFSLNILSGDKSPLKEPYSIVLTDETAQAIFGNADAVGRIVKLDNKVDLKVTAVVSRQPKNATLQFDYLLPWRLQENIYDWVSKYLKDNWANNGWGVYVQLKPGVDPALTNAKIRNVVLSHFNDPNTKNLVKPEIFLHPMSKWRLYSEFTDGQNAGGFIKYVRLFGIFGLFILVIACINFMNLSTARSGKRAKEVGVRKSVGSGRQQLIGQFLSESVQIAFMALALALIIVFFSLPYFNLLTEKTMHIEFKNPVFWGILLVFTLFTGLLAGSYPALYLSSFNPVQILKGGIRVGKSATLPRKVLVVVQFTFSIVLMIGTIVIYQQIRHGKSRPIGFTKEGLISVSSSDDLVSHFEALRTELLETGVVSSISKSNSPPTQWWSSNAGWEWKGSTPEDKSSVFITVATNYDYVKTMGIKIKEGRDFSRDFVSDSSGVILNEAAVKRMGLKHPIGEILKWGRKERTVVGVIPDIVMEWSPYRAVSPLTILFEKDKNWVGFLCVRLNPNVSSAAAIEKIRPIFDKYNPGFPFDYKFSDMEYGKKFYYEELIGDLSAIVCLLAIFISCLGLFGLASFMAEQRTKEIGIRKVLGASVANVWGLLSGDFIQLVLISCLVASPVAWYFMNQWLQDYTYKINIGFGVFLVVFVMALVITLLTVSYQAVKAALINPVRSLKSE
jgi:putative ABC transport system permease protein